MKVDRASIRKVLGDVAAGRLDVDRALERLKHLPSESIAVASRAAGVRFDHHRELRTGVPEVVYGEGKSFETLRALVGKIDRTGGRLLITRADPSIAERLVALFPDLQSDPLARTIVVGRPPAPARSGGVGIVWAGTTDAPVAREAAVTAAFLGRRVVARGDVGVAGLHRLVGILPELGSCRAIVAVAGMEGALPSVLAGLVGVPVVAVPTSVGYGAAFRGLAALLAMMNSCAPGVSVVNIDNGFGGAVVAAKIDRLGRGPRDPARGGRSRRS